MTLLDRMFSDFVKTYTDGAPTERQRRDLQMAFFAGAAMAASETNSPRQFATIQRELKEWIEGFEEIQAAWAEG